MQPSRSGTGAPVKGLQLTTTPPVLPATRPSTKEAGTSLNWSIPGLPISSSAAWGSYLAISLKPKRAKVSAVSGLG